MVLEMSPSGEVATGPGTRQIYYDFEAENIESVKVRHVLVETEELADFIVQSVKSGEQTLQELAQTLSTDSESKALGGDLGWCRRGDKVLGPQLEDFVFQSRVNVTQKVKTARGWHVVRVEDAKHHLRPTTNSRDVHLMSKKKPPKMQVGSLERIENTYNVTTMGCQMNQADSERMSAELERLGFTPIEDANKASVVVFNTCSIRDHAEQKVYSYVGSHARRKWVYPDIKLVVAGCVAQQEGERLLRRVPELDLVMGPQYSNRLGDLLEQVSAGSQVSATEPIHIMEDIAKPRRTSSVTAWVNIIYGCNERCTYCVVPNTRGLEQSRPRDAIKEEIRHLAAEGFREVVLLGQNIDAYGRDLRPRDTFAGLLKHIHDVPGLERIRFTTSHPRYISANLIRTCAELDKVMPHFHFPFQSGDNDVLKAMSRGYSVETYLKIVQRIREHMPDASIAADAIVAFPGESEEQFLNTLKLMDEVKFDQVNTAAYSPRPHTPAALWDNQLSEEVKDDRLQRINRQNTADALERSQRYLGRIEEVLVEETNPRNPKQVLGRTKTNKLTFLEGDIEELRGKLVDVRIVEIFAFSIRGERVEGSPLR